MSRDIVTCVHTYSRLDWPACHTIRHDECLHLLNMFKFLLFMFQLLSVINSQSITKHCHLKMTVTNKIAVTPPAIHPSSSGQDDVEDENTVGWFFHQEGPY